MAIKIGKSIVKMVRVMRDEDMIIKPRLNQWLKVHGDDAFPKEIAVWVYNQLITAERDRRRSFSSSSGGRCMREQLFQFLGVEQQGSIEPEMEQVYQDGTWRHLRLQAQLASAGIIELDGLEYPLDWPAMRSKGTVDGTGTVPDDHPRKEWRGKLFGLELKGANTFVVQKMDDPTKYLNQVARYFLSGGFDLFVIYVEDKNNQEVREWVLDANDPAMQKLIQQQANELSSLNVSVDQRVMPPMLPGCHTGKGKEWKECPYGGSDKRPCPQITTWRDANKFTKKKPKRGG